MVNPQESLDQGILTQYSELSDLTSSDQTSSKVKAPPSLSGHKLLNMASGTPLSNSSSSPSFKSPGSATTLSLATQPEDGKTVVVDVEDIESPPAVKRELKFTKENDNPQPKKKAKKQAIKCCGRCGELKMICLDMANDTVDSIKNNNQYRVHTMNCYWSELTVNFDK